MYINKSWYIVPVGQAWISSLILLRSLRMYVLIQLFFSIWVNSGFINLFIRGSVYNKISHYSPRNKPLFADHPPPPRPILPLSEGEDPPLGSTHFLFSKRTSVVSMFYTLYHKAHFFHKSECALYLNFIIEMQSKTKPYWLRVQNYV